MISLPASPFASTRRLTSMFELLDSCQQSAIEVDMEATVIRMNRTAEDLLALRVGIGIAHQNRLVADRPSETHRLRKFIASAAENGCPSQKALVTIPFSQRNLLMSLVPICLDCRAKSGGTCDYHVVLLPVRSQQAISVPEDIIGKTYSLTTAETRVAKQILMGNSPSGIAECHNVSINTVRTQLRSIYRKSNTTGQYEFAAKILIDCISPLIFWRGNSPKADEMEQLT